MATHTEIIRHNVAETVRVRREGGHGWILLPGSRPGTLLAIRIDQNGAEELFARYLDMLMADTLRRQRAGGAMSHHDQRVLQFRSVELPHHFQWASLPDGEHCLMSLNERYERPEFAEWLPLSAHPLRYALPWRVPELRRNRIDPGFESGLISILPDSDGVLPLLSAWTRLEHINDAMWREGADGAPRR